MESQQKSSDLNETKSAADLILGAGPKVWMKCPAPGCDAEVVVLSRMGFCGSCTEKKQAEIDAEKAVVARKATAEARVLQFLKQKGADEYHFDKYQTELGNSEAFNAAKAFDPLRDNLYIFGPCGTGKTHLAGALFREALYAGHEAVIYTPPQLMRLFRGKESREEDALLKRFSLIPVFVIDDLGVGKATEFANQILYEIIGLREADYRNGLVITSNLSLDEIMVKMGEARFKSRVGGMCRAIRVSGKDRRTA